MRRRPGRPFHANTYELFQRSNTSHPRLAGRTALETVEKRHSEQPSNIYAPTRMSAGTFFSEKCNLKRYVTRPTNLDHYSNTMMTSTEISHVALQYYVLCNITHNLSFADAQLLGKFRMKSILNTVNNTTLPMLRHDNDAEANRKTGYNVLRSVKNQGNNFDSK
jgi:hypothetical protein